MPISEGLQYSVMFWTALSTTGLSFILRKEEGLKIALKIASTLCWFMLALSSFTYGDRDLALTLPSTYLFFALGFIILFSTINDWRSNKKGSWLKGLEE